MRAKRVTDPLDDKARARLVGAELMSYDSSGSEHSADESPCLSELVHSFLEDSEYYAEATQSPSHDSDTERVDSVADCRDVLEEISASNTADTYRLLILCHVSKAVEAFSCIRDEKSVLRRQVMTLLRGMGHNAAVCKVKWDSHGGTTAGSHEFIDVVQSATSTSQNRYIVDLDFASQFEIARPTCQYSSLLQSLPRIFVGRVEDLKRIVKAVCDAAKRSLKSRGLSLPPWRKNRYMQNKWFGPYRRTVNPVPPAIGSVNCVKCRFVGFDDAVNGSLIVRTR